MSRREDIVNDIWVDEPFADLSGAAQHVYIWSWTNGLCNMAGLYKTRRQLIGGGKWDDATLDGALDELARAQMMFFEPPWLWNRSRAKRLASKSPMMARSVAKDIAKVPADNSLRGAFLAHYSDDPWLREALAPLVRETTFNVEQLPLSTPSREGVETFPTPPKQSQIPTPSPDLPEKVQRTGTGKEVVEEHPRVRELAQVMAKLNEIPGDRRKLTELDYPQLLSAIEAHRDADPMQAALAAHARGRQNLNRTDAFLRELRALETRQQTAAKREEHKPPPSAVYGSGEDRPCRDCGRTITSNQAINRHGRCDDCYETFERNLIGEEAVA